MNRRNLLKWVSGALATASAAIIGLPGGRFVVDVLGSRRRDQAVVKRVARLDELAPGQPRSFPVLGSRSDAWTLYPEEVIGRVWLLRSDGAEGDQPKVTAFTAMCPHLGCAVQLDAGRKHFTCPCHRAAFDLKNGQPLSEENGKKSHAPRGMDELDCRVVQDSDDGGWWIEVKYQKFEPGLTVKVAKV